MKVKVRRPVSDGKGGYTLHEINAEDIVVDKCSIMSIDGSTSNTGIAILGREDCSIKYILAVEHEHKLESPVVYKIKLKKIVKEILYKNKLINQTYYEEPNVCYVSSVKNLFMLRTFIEELVIEEEPNLNYVKHFEINNMRWKKIFLEPEKIPAHTEEQKKAVREKLFNMLPFLSNISQDEVDAICMGAAIIKMLRTGQSGSDLESKEKPRAFKYNAEFIGADCDEEAFDTFYDAYTGPKKVMENGICFCELNNRSNFDKSIYEAMGNEDKVVVIKFSSSKQADVILKNNIGNLSAQFAYLYAIVWRKTRKY